MSDRAAESPQSCSNEAGTEPEQRSCVPAAAHGVQLTHHLQTLRGLQSHRQTQAKYSSLYSDRHFTLEKEIDKLPVYNVVFLEH